MIGRSSNRIDQEAGKSNSFGVKVPDPALEMPEEEVELMLLFKEIDFEYLGTRGRSSMNILY